MLWVYPPSHRAFPRPPDDKYPRMHQAVDPPMLVDIFPRDMWPGKLFMKVPMIVRSQGVDGSGPIPGTLHRWLMASHGGWLGLVDMVAYLWDEPIELRCLCPASCIFPRGRAPWDPRAVQRTPLD